MKDNEAKGDCIEANVKKFLDMFNDNYLCQGIIKGRGKIEGVRMAHCWIEVNGLCFDFCNERFLMLPKHRYYEIARLEYVVRYTEKELWRHLAKTKRYQWYDPYIYKLVENGEIK